MLSGQEDAPRLVTPCPIQAEAHMMVDRAGWAARAYARYDRAAAMRIARAVAEAAYAAAARYAEWAVRETGMGVVEHKRLKNELSSHALVDFYEEMDLVSAKVDPMRKIIEIPKPAGAIFALTPVTNPVSTLYYKTLIALLSRNAILFAPHPMAKACCRDAAELLEAAAIEAGAPAGLIQCLAEPSASLAQAIMASPKIAVILATGGGAMVRAAYSSGTPAIGVGPGNVPAYIDPSADQAKAAQALVNSKSFDHSILCTNESVAITLRENRHSFERALRAAGAWICTEQETQRLRDWLFPGGHLRTAAIGKSAAWIAQQVGIHTVSSTRLLVAPIERVGVDEVFSKEKLCPVLGLIAVDRFERAIRTAQMMLRMQGGGHSAAFHGNMPQRAIDYASHLNVYRVVVNAPCSQGASGFATHLPPSFTIGTGYFGRASIGENIGPQHLVQWTRLAWNSDPGEVFDGLCSVQLPFEGPVDSGCVLAAPPQPANASAGGVDRDLLRQMILQELRALNQGLP